MADKNIAWYDWVKYKSEKNRKKREKGQQVEWSLRESLMPVTQKKIRVGYGEYRNEWIVNGKKTPSNFIYLLIDFYTREIKYVGMTDDPLRRYTEHKNKDRIGTRFTMIVVDEGGFVTEQRWINELTSKGCKLLNIVSADAATKNADYNEVEVSVKVKQFLLFS